MTATSLQTYYLIASSLLHVNLRIMQFLLLSEFLLQTPEPDLHKMLLDAFGNYLRFLPTL